MHLTKLIPALAGGLVLALLSPATKAQSTAPHGTLHGVVSDSQTGNYLSGAEVTLNGSNLKVSTETDGSFTLGDAPTGAGTLHVTYLGYDAEDIPVMVNPGDNAPTVVRLSASAVQMTKFVVEGALEGQARAINQQQQQTGKVSMVAADAIGNFPDQNAAQALQRVSGVSVQQLYGQATTVSIRGAGSDYNTTTLDGVAMVSNAAVFGQAGSNSANGRSVSLSDFPAQILSSVTVVKTVTPDLEANAIGGIVQLKTKSPFDFNDPVIDFNVGEQYSSQAKKFEPLAGLAVIERFGKDKDWGFAVTASDERRKGLEEQIEVKSEGTESYLVNGTNYTGYTMLQPELGNYDYDEHRLAASVSLEKKFGDTTHLYIRATRTLWIQKSGRPSLDLIDNTASNALVATAPVTVSNGEFEQYTMSGVSIQRSVNPRTVSDSTDNLLIGGDVNLDDWKITASFGYNKGFGEVSARGSQWQSTTKATVAYNYTEPMFPSYSIVSGPNINDPSQFNLTQFKANETLQNTDQYTAKLDAEHTIDLGGAQLTLKAGGVARWADLDNSKLAPTYAVAAGQTLNMASTAYSHLLDANPDFLSRYDLGPAINPFAFANYAQANPQLFTLNAAKTLATDLGGDNSIQEDVYAGYFMGTLNWGKWNLIAGLRYEETQDDSKGYEIPGTSSADPSAYPVLSYDNDYGKAMPGVLLRYEATKRLIFRAAWTNTLARPDTTYLAPSQNVTLQPSPSLANPDLVTGGNPDLKATTSNNWDASADYYFPGIGIASVGGFYKSIKDPVYQNTYTGTFQGEPALITGYSNAGDAWLRGLEFEYQQNLTFLPKAFTGLNAYANMTIVKSSVHVPTNPGVEYPFFNQANKVYNLGLSYQRSGLYARLAYNWTSSYLFSIDGPTLAEYAAPYHSLDALITYKFARHWTFKVTGNNLTGVPTRSYFNTPQNLDVYAQDGRFFTTSLNWEY